MNKSKSYSVASYVNTAIVSYGIESIVHADNLGLNSQARVGERYSAKSRKCNDLLGNLEGYKLCKYTIVIIRGDKLSGILAGRRGSGHRIIAISRAHKLIPDLIITVSRLAVNGERITVDSIRNIGKHAPVIDSRGYLIADAYGVLGGSGPSVILRINEGYGYGIDTAVNAAVVLDYLVEIVSYESRDNVITGVFLIGYNGKIYSLLRYVNGYVNLFRKIVSRRGSEDCYEGMSAYVAYRGFCARILPGPSTDGALGKCKTQKLIKVDCILIGINGINSVLCRENRYRRLCGSLKVVVALGESYYYAVDTGIDYGNLINDLTVYRIYEARLTVRLTEARYIEGLAVIGVCIFRIESGDACRSFSYSKAYGCALCAVPVGRICHNRLNEVSACACRLSDRVFSVYSRGVYVAQSTEGRARRRYARALAVGPTAHRKTGNNRVCLNDGIAKNLRLLVAIRPLVVVGIDKRKSYLVATYVHTAIVGHGVESIVYAAKSGLKGSTRVDKFGRIKSRKGYRCLRYSEAYRLGLGTVVVIRAVYYSLHVIVTCKVGNLGGVLTCIARGVYESDSTEVGGRGRSFRALAVGPTVDRNERNVYLSLGDRVANNLGCLIAIGPLVVIGIDKRKSYAVAAYVHAAIVSNGVKSRVNADNLGLHGITRVDKARCIKSRNCAYSLLRYVNGNLNLFRKIVAVCGSEDCYEGVSAYVTNYGILVYVLPGPRAYVAHGESKRGDLVEVDCILVGVYVVNRVLSG